MFSIERRRSCESSSSNRFSSKSPKDHNSETSRKLDYETSLSASSKSRRKLSESDNSNSRRRSEDETSKRRSIRSIEKLGNYHPQQLKTLSSSSSSEEEDDTEVRNLLTQSRSSLENTEALRIKSQYLRPEDYVRKPIISNSCDLNSPLITRSRRRKPITNSSLASLDENVIVVEGCCSYNGKNRFACFFVLLLFFVGLFAVFFKLSRNWIYLEN